MQPIIDWVLSVMETVGGPGIALAIFLENLFPPIPSEVVLPLAGFSAADGQYTIVEAVLWATLGSVTGALVLYGFGAAVGMDRMRVIAHRMPLVDVADVDKTDAWFTRHGRKAVFFGRLVPGIRSLISIPAGVDRMPLGQFIGMTTAGSLIWNTGLVSAGYALGSRYHLVEQYMDPISKAVYALILLAGVGVIVFLVRRSKKRGQDPDDAIDRGTL
ncbi:membrane protein [Knoellia sinensis KCTC 19936]|uniref:Membrane protein n=1 Tax=Knoellia sinensis KCTC 19936 TaxID=1385520 RepID=A0A0A0JAN1_9MICO|nr:DedA family protein [Knoellia sinensis]KGN34203.1 membrane protein [Knoellia sinensis KCTC 19936]